MKSVSSIGIDLGTSNCVCAVCRDEKIDVLPVSQLAAPNSVRESPQLPSAIYLPAEAEFPPEAIRLPWETSRRPLVIGEFAREHGAKSADRVVVSAKSWLCNPAVDRKSAILPWSSEIGESEKISPFDATCEIARHLRNNLVFHHPELAAAADSGAVEIVVTVPASFDEVARNLTYHAVASAEWGTVRLLEEPLAAFYAWIASHLGQDAAGGRWQDQVEAGDIVLVCDVGGGTADFSLIALGERDRNLELTRISVGDHILLGGDNMDLALAFLLRAKLEAAGKTIGNWQLLNLIQQTRIAKERLFEDDQLEQMPVSIAAKGSGLFAQTLSTTLERGEAERLIIDGFFPLTEPDQFPDRGPESGLAELGLPYAQDAALTKHLAKFLHQSWINAQSDAQISDIIQARMGASGGNAAEGQKLLMPSAVLFNGGVFRSAQLRQRVMECLNRWSMALGRPEPVKELTGSDFNLAVGRGAAYYGHVVSSGKGVRIRAGLPRSFYIGVRATGMAVPGFTPPVRGVCILPQGTEEGAALTLDNHEFAAVIGQTSKFRLFSSHIRAGDQPGTVVEDAARELEELPPLEVTLPAEDGEEPGTTLPVKLEAVTTEVGTLELWLTVRGGLRRWKLEFNLRKPG